METSVHSALDTGYQDAGTGFSRRAPNVGPRALPDVPPGEHYRPLTVRKGGEGLANFLGWFSVGLGISQLVAPDAVARLIGVRPTERTRSTMRALGMREMTSGVGILSNRRRADWLWSRVAGDVMDLALLARAMEDEGNDRRKTGAAIAAVAGVTALDFLSAQQVGEWRGSLFQDQDSNDGRRPGAGGSDRFETATRVTPAEAGSRRNNTARGLGRSADLADKGHRRVTHAVTINKSLESIYEFWRNFENLPRFMRHLESVKVLDNTRSHWKANAPAGMSVEWDAEITEDRPNELISWRSLAGADVYNAGTVRFTSAPGGRGTEVRVDMEYSPPGGKAGVLVAKLFREEPSQQVHDDLRHFKQVMELGEIVLSDASVRKGMHPAQPTDKPVEMKL